MVDDLQDEPAGDSADGGLDRPPGYRFVGQLGDGAEGGAWKAQDRGDGATVVLKRVPASARARLRHAFSVLRQVGSPNLPAPKALVEGADGSLWLVTDWVGGSPVPPGPVPVAQAVREVASVARALSALHESGTHHGDVSPGNVLLDGDTITLVDLAQLGRLGTGTPGFTAPEVLQGSGGPAADRFSLGCLLAWRLWGEAPWPRPEQQLRVQTRADVVARVSALGGDAIPASVRAVLIRLLLPRADARPSSTRELAARLAQLAESRVDPVLRSVRWWSPRRWPYEGADPTPVVEAVVRGRCSLVAVAGPPGGGRGRIMEELIQRLQVRGHGAQMLDTEAWLAAAGSEASSWMEVWMGAPAESAVGLLDVTVDASLTARVAAAARIARSVVVVAVDPEAARRLEGAPGVVVIRARALHEPEVESLLASALDAPADRIAAWARALREATGGWPGALVRTAQACAAQQMELPSPATIEAALNASADGGALDPELARSLLHAAWAVEPNPALPQHLAPQGLPHAAARSASRAALGPAGLRAEARRRVAAVEGRVSLALAVDADEPDLVQRALRGRPGWAEVSRAVAWVEGRATVPAGLRAFAMDRRLAEGNAGAAAALASGAPDDRACRFAHARALQRLGRRDEALALLADDAGDEEPLRWAKRGLRWRVWVDQGEAARADAQARALQLDEPAVAVAEAGGHGVALALLWAAYAALVAGDPQGAATRLERARARVQDAADPASASVAARVLQLVGNLAHARGELSEAARAFDEAAKAFVRAGESVGGLTLRGSLCALAIPTLSLEAGIDHGRAALRGLLAQGQLSALVEAALNLVQLLGRVAAVEESASIVAAVEAALEQGGTPLDRARLLRLRVEPRAAALVHDPGSRTGRAEVEQGFVGAATALEAARAPGEAADALLRAATLARLQGRVEDARSYLRRVQRLRADGGAEVGAQVAHCAIEATVAMRCGDAAGLEQVLQRLRTCATHSGLVAAGQLDSAIAFDRTMLQALRHRAGFSSSTRRAVATRLMSTLETVMQKTKPIDRSAARASLVGEGGDTQVLRELLEDLEGGTAAGPIAAPSPAGAPSAPGDRFERLLRMYRRFAREDRLEPLLEQVVDAVMELTDAERGAVVVRREGASALEVTRELSEGSEGASFSRSVINRVLESSEPVMSVDAAADDRFDDSRSISHLNLRSVLAVPLCFRGNVLGAVYVDHRLRRGNFGEDDLAHMEAFADLAALAVAHAAALEEVCSQTEQLETQSALLAELLEQREAEVVALREDARHQAPARSGYRGIVGGARSMQNVFRLIDRLADAEVPVVVYGESGTGKELVARAIHDAGTRGRGPFVAENCGAIPETLLETVLFGHAKGAFTGAQKAKAGLFEAADGGTIFLDEVSEMSPAMQTKLLRVLQEGEVRRVGETGARKVDVRVVAACNRDLEALVDSGEFRRDLFYRISVVRVELPPLRERVEDLRPLIDHFLQRHGGTRSLEITPSALRALSGFAWPGNVRQLENEVQRWVALCEGAVGVEDLSAAIGGAPRSEGFDPDDLRIRPRVDRMERDLIARALQQTGGNQTKAAALLGLSRYGLQKKLKRLEL